MSLSIAVIQTVGICKTHRGGQFRCPIGKLVVNHRGISDDEW